MSWSDENGPFGAAGGGIDHSAMRLGRTPPKPTHLAKVPKLSSFLVEEELPEPPAVIDLLAGMSSIPMLGNDQYGDCVEAGILHHIQALTAAMGQERVFTTPEAVELYEAIVPTFDPNDPETDQGTNLVEALMWWKANGVFGYEIEGFAAIDPRNWRKRRQAMHLFGGVLWGVSLPKVAQFQSEWRVEMGRPDDQLAPAGWGRHCVSDHRSVLTSTGRPDDEPETWGGTKKVTGTWDDVYGDEAYVVLLKGWTPPNLRGFDRDALLRAMEGVSP
jgi:hypothetical protein